MSSRVLEESLGTLQDIFEDHNMSQVAIIAAVAFIIFTILLVFILSGRKSKKRTILLTGVSEAGKTALFTKLIFQKETETYTSIKENSGLYYCASKGKDIPFVDIPGNERQRLQFWEKFKDEVRGVIFMVDSSKFQKEVKEVAEFLYILLTDPAVHRSKLRLLVACNKQDVALAKSAKVIQTQLEKELNTLRVTKAASLNSTDDSSRQSQEYFLGKEGKSFEFSHLSPMKVEFVESICKGSDEKPVDVASIEEWIKTVAK